MDRAELERELEQLHPASYRWALGLCGRNREEAEEVLQTVYLKIFQGKARFDGRSSLKTWIFAVIRKTAMAQLRSRWLHRLALGRLVRLTPRRMTERSVEGKLEHSQEVARLLAALGRLARRQREMIELVFYHELTIEQAARTLGISVGSARVHYDRAKKRLSKLLQEEVEGIERLGIESPKNIR